MSKRYLWLLGLLTLVGIGLLVACTTTYRAASDGLIVVGSQGSNVLETFSIDLGSGHTFAVSNSPNDTSGQTCLIPGQPTFMVVDPAGQYAYAIIQATLNCPKANTTGIASFKLNSDGTIGAMSSITVDPNPVGLTMDASGKYLFVAEGTQLTATNQPLLVDAYAINNGAITALTPTFNFNNGLGFGVPNIVAVAATPSLFPQINAVCATTTGVTNPTTQFLYAADKQNNVVWEFGVDMTSGALKNPGNFTGVQFYAAGAQPNGVAVDGCNRFVYVANEISNNVSEYTICNGGSTSPTTCTNTDGSLLPVSGSPQALAGSATYPGPMLSDPYGNTLYVLETGANTVSTFKISPVSGKLTVGNPATVATGLGPTSMAIRSDDSYLFVANFQAATVSEYAITPSTGSLTPETAIDTDNYPYGVAVK